MSITITINGFSDPGKASKEIVDKIREAAAIALEKAGTFHVEQAKYNIKHGYKLKDEPFPPISLDYAKDLLQKDGKEFESEGEEIVAAWELIGKRAGMIDTETLIDGVEMSGVNREEGSIRIISTAPYSKNLEEGIYFGKHTNRQRRFFTRHKWQTKDILKKSFIEAINEIGD